MHSACMCISFLRKRYCKRGMMYDGEVDTAGRPHGRGTLLESDGTVFRGRFDHGVRHGRGSLLTSDGAVVSGVWRADVLEGEARRDFSDGSGRWQECQYREGKALGIGRQYGPTGDTLYKGPLHNWSPHGQAGVLWLRAGGVAGNVDGALRGNWEHGQIHGDGIEFVYPDGSRLRGLWSRGVMVAAIFVPELGGRWGEIEEEEQQEEEEEVAVEKVVQEERSNASHARAERRRRRMQMSQIPQQPDSIRRYSYDPSTRDRISKQPLLPDPYETRTVYVGPSRVRARCGVNAGEGLFARRAMCAGRIVSWYNGVRVPCAEVDNRPDWSLNDNVINLDEDTAIDVPPELSSCKAYCASLGHKANHARPGTNNAEYDDCFHPRFGEIKCIRLVRDVAAGEEITVDYCFLDETPDWYDAEIHGLTVTAERRGSDSGIHSSGAE